MTDSNIKSAAVDNEADIKKRARSELPKEKAALKSEGYKIFVLALLLGVICIILIFYAWNRAEQADHSKEVLYIQMYPDGTSRVLKSLPQDVARATTAAVESALSKFINSCQGQHRETIRRDYSECSVFLESALYNKFIGKDVANGDYDAASKAASIIADKSANIVEIDWRFADHYDEVLGTFDGKEQPVLRSNIYYTKITRDTSGRVINTEYLIDRLQWRLLPKSVIEKQAEDWLRVNPIGLKIVSENIITDPSPSAAKVK